MCSTSVMWGSRSRPCPISCAGGCGLPQIALTAFSREIEGVLIGYLCHSQDREVYQKDLERALCIRSSTASRLLTRLEAQGLIQRSMGTKDARMKRITPTLRAQTLNEEAEQRIAATEALLTRGISGRRSTASWPQRRSSSAT